MNDARFFAMVGIGVPAANKIEIFKASLLKNPKRIPKPHPLTGLV